MPGPINRRYDLLLIIAQQFYCLKKTIIILLVCTLFVIPSYSQKAQFSLATDFTVFRSFKKEQQFWTVGQTVAGHFNFSEKNGFYAWITYSGNGKFSNRLTATAKTVFTSPLLLDYTNTVIMRFRHVSMGWKHYLKGTFNSEDSWNLYGYAGFGLMFGNVENLHSNFVDTTEYFAPVLKGNADFKRLTFDLGLGYEKPVGGNVNIYLEARVLIPTTYYPSHYLLINNHAPLIGSINTGFRILFD